MTSGLQKWVKERRWELLSCTPIVGGYAASLFRVQVQTEQGEEVEAVYKQFSPGRDRELELYRNVLPQLAFGAPVLYGEVCIEGECGLVMEAAGQTLKPRFLQADVAGKKKMLRAAVELLAELHVSLEAQSVQWVKDGVISPYPYESSEQWAGEAMAELRALDDFDAAVVREMEAMAVTFYPHYVEWTAGRQTFTHGDPHMENLLVDRGRYRLIDWEYASTALPQRDVAILLQDVLDEGLHGYALTCYLEALEQRGWLVDREEFVRGWHACLFDNTLMMLGWEVGKYRKGHLGKTELEEILQRKIGWMRESYQALVRGKK